MPERWLPVVGYEGLYEVSDQGRVWSEITQRYLKPWLTCGKPQVMLTGRRHRYIHDLMLETFVGPRPKGKEACHYNDIGADNRLENLRWDTRSANRQDSVRNGTHRNTRKTECPNGHKYTIENTAYTVDMNRRCRTCNRMRARV